MLESDILANIDIKRQPHVAEVARSILKGAKNRKIRTTLNSRQSPTNSIKSANIFLDKKGTALLGDLNVSKVAK